MDIDQNIDQNTDQNTDQEKIGNVSLDYTFYPGKDLYSDGKVEDRLLEIAKNYPEEELNRVIAQEKSWPVLYHFSHIRQNIVSWLPLTKEDAVLEIGSGCGAVTGALARKAGSVTCVDLSRKRSLVNAYRHRKMDNISILVGNFKDVEKTLGTYDLITLIGVFEYSGSYIGGKTPFSDMLRIVSSHLKPEGKLVIAIENRLGLKYWAGCTEDHCGCFFEGLEDYPAFGGARTFSRKEMEKLMEGQGNLKWKTYYPYPDYKFPLTIYSDSRLPLKDEIRNADYNFDRSRLRLFDERRVTDTLLSNDLYPEFANSFLLLISGKEAREPENSCVYVKYSNERDPALSLRTEIHKGQNGGFSVRKYADQPESLEFLKNIVRNYGLLKQQYAGTKIRMNPASMEKDHISFHFCSGIRMDEKLDQFLKNDRSEEVWQMLNRYFDLLRALAQIPFSPTEDFEKVFGKQHFPRQLYCQKISDIDPICENLLEAEEGFELLDYEWSFDFPVPVDFIIYRIIRYYLYTSTLRHCLEPLDFFARAGIAPEEQEIYAGMEEHFQKYILGSRVPMRNMYPEITPGVLFDVRKIDEIRRAQDAKKMHIYVDLGQDFTEDNSWLEPVSDSAFCRTIRVPRGTLRMRMDPCEEPCLLSGLSLKVRTGEEMQKLSSYGNGCQISEEVLFFDTSDPYLIIDLPQGAEEVEASMEIVRLSGADTGHLLLAQAQQQKQCLAELKKRRNELENELKRQEEILKQREQLILEMKNTKVWKLYTKIKKQN